MFAFNGILILIREEHNARIHLLVLAAVIAAGLFFKISQSEWMAIVIASGMVLALEAVNAAIENLADFISPGKHHLIKKVKDLAAAAVLIAAIAASIIGLLIFLPEFIRFFEG